MVSIAVLFDMDGVIFDSEPIHERIFIEYAAELGFTFPSSEYVTMIGTSSVSQWRKMKKQHNLEGTPQELSDAKMVHYKKHLAETTGYTPIPGIAELLHGLKENSIPFALASSNTNDIIEATLNSIGLADVITVRVGGDEVENAKPDPAIFLLAADKLGVKPEQCVVIEDSTNGVEAAHRAGMACVGFDNPNSPGQDLSKASLRVKSILEVTPAVLTEQVG